MRNNGNMCLLDWKMSYLKMCVRRFSMKLHLILVKIRFTLISIFSRWDFIVSLKYRNISQNAERRWKTSWNEVVESYKGGGGRGVAVRCLRKRINQFCKISIILKIQKKTAVFVSPIPSATAKIDLLSLIKVCGLNNWCNFYLNLLKFIWRLSEKVLNPK